MTALALERDCPRLPSGTHQSPKTATVSIALLREMLDALFDPEACDTGRLASDLAYLIDIAEGVHPDER
jgi:hypothetical protein